MMQGENRFLKFAEQIIARHREPGLGFEPAMMLFLEDQPQQAADQTAMQQFTTNLYHIRNITEENYLFRQNLTFLTQVLENKMYRNLYPSVEKQIEKTIREELPQAQETLVEKVSHQMYRLVQQGGVEQFEKLKTQILSEYEKTENITLREQQTLLRKLENIWNSSVYERRLHTDRTLAERHETFFHQETMIPGQTGKAVSAREAFRGEHRSATAPPQLTLQYEESTGQEQASAGYEILQREREKLLREQALVVKRLEETITEKETSQKMQETLFHEREKLEKLLRERETIKTEHEKLLKDRETVETEHEKLLQDRETVQTERETLLQERERLEKLLKERETIETEHEKLLKDRETVQTEQETLLHEREKLEKQLRERETIETEHEKLLKDRKTVQTEREKLEQLLRERETVQTENEKLLNTQEILQTVQKTLTELPETAADGKIIFNRETLRERARQATFTELLKSQEPFGEVPLIQRSDAARQGSEMIYLETDEAEAPESPALQTENVLERTLKLIEVQRQFLSKTVETEKLLRKELPIKKFTKKELRNMQLEYSVEEVPQSISELRKILSPVTQVLQVPERTEVIKAIEKTGRIPERILSRMETADIFLTAQAQTAKRTAHFQAQHFAQGRTPMMEQAPIIYRPEDTLAPEQQQKNRQLERKVNEIVKTVKQVEEKTIVSKERIIEQQKEVAKEVLRSNAALLVEGETAGYIQSRVQQSVEAQIDQSVDQIANRVYRRLEERLRSERGRRGLI